MAHLEALARPLADTLHLSLVSGRHALHWVAVHTGLPVVVVAALGLVLAWRVGRRTWHVAFELALALAVLLVATKFGWVHW